MTFLTHTPGHNKAQLKTGSQSSFRNYAYRNPQLAKLEKALVSPFLKLMMEPEPAQNPNGYREIDQRAEEMTRIVFEKFGALSQKKAEIIECFDASKHDVHVSNSNGKLLEALIEPPTYLDWGRPINSHEKKFAFNKTNRLVATAQWAGMALTLLDLGTKIYVATPDKSRKEGTFACDIGVVIDDELYMCNMTMPERRTEMATLKNGVRMPWGMHMEGGDVYVFKKGVFVGISDRTDAEAAEWLQEKTKRDIVPVKLNKISLHFDVPVMPIDEHGSNGGGALVYHPGVHAASIAKIEAVFGKENVHSMSESLFRDLRANVQVVDAGVALVDFGETHVEAKLRKFGFTTLIETPYHETKKGGGSHHCSVLAIVKAD